MNTLRFQDSGSKFGVGPRSRGLETQQNKRLKVPWLLLLFLLQNPEQGCSTHHFPEFRPHQQLSLPG